MFCGLTKYETQKKFPKSTFLRPSWLDERITTWIHRQVLITINLLNIAQQMTPSLLLEATRTQLCQTTVLAVFVASDTKSIAQVRKTISLSAATNQANRCTAQNIFFVSHPIFCVQKQQPFFVRFGLPYLFWNN